MPIYRSTQTVEAMQWRGPQDTEAVRTFLGSHAAVADSLVWDIVPILFLASPKAAENRSSAAVFIVEGDYVFRFDNGFSIFGAPGSGKYFLESYELVSP